VSQQQQHGFSIPFNFLNMESFLTTQEQTDLEADLNGGKFFFSSITLENTPALALYLRIGILLSLA
jgi:hypothetical protein